MITITSKIGSVDLVRERGIHVLLGGIEDFLSYPPTKKPPTTDWYEMDGVEADLSELYLDKRTFKMPFTAKVLDSLTKLASDLKEWQVMDLTHHTGITRRVYFESATLDKSKHTLNCRFTEFAPKVPEEVVPTPIKGDFGKQPTIDSKPITEFGFCLISEDSDRQIITKIGTVITKRYDHGVIYLERSNPKRASYTAKMDLFSPGTNCINNYNALVSYLMKSKRCLLNGRHYFYLKQTKVKKYHQANTPYLLITIELQII